MKVLLISVQDYREQLGLKLLHYQLLLHGYDSTLFYLKYFDKSCAVSLHAVKQFLKKINPSFIGISLMSIDYHKAITITQIIREVLPDTPVVWGGIHPSIYPEMCLEYADYVSVGESEQTLLDMAEAVSQERNFEHINNLVYKKNGEIIKNPLYPPVENLDSFTPYEHIAKNTYVLEEKKIQYLTSKLFKQYDKTQGTSYSVVTSRGCPFSCTYCCNNFYKTLYNYKKIRRRGVEHIIQELEETVKHNPYLDFINFEDDSFLSGSLSYIEDFAKEYKRRVGIPFIVHSIPVSISEEKIVLLKTAGLAWVNVGLQSGSDDTLKNIYKRASLKTDFLNAAAMLKKHKVACFYDVLVDNPFESEKDKLATLETVYEIPKPYIIRVFSLTFYPGSELYERFVHAYPQHALSYLEKNFCMPTNENYNHILKMMPFLFRWQIEMLIKSYKKEPDSTVLKYLLFILRYINLIFIKPFRLFKLIRMSYQGSRVMTFKKIDKYVLHYLSKHILHKTILKNKGILPF